MRSKNKYTLKWPKSDGHLCMEKMLLLLRKPRPMKNVQSDVTELD